MEQEPSNGCSFVRNREKKNHRKRKPQNTNLGNKRPARGWLWPWLAIPAQGWSKRSNSEQRHPREELKQGKYCNSLLLSKTGKLHRLFTQPFSARREHRASCCLWKWILAHEQDSTVRLEEAPTYNYTALMSLRIDEYFISFHPEYLEGFSFQEKRKMQIHSNGTVGHPAGSKRAMDLVLHLWIPMM